MNDKQITANFSKSLKRVSTLHIFSPASGLSGKALVCVKAEKWELDITHLDIRIGLLEPSEIEAVEKKKIAVYSPSGLGMCLVEFMFFLCSNGFITPAELKKAYSGAWLHGSVKEAPFIKRAVIETFVACWPREGLDSSLFPSLIRRLRSAGFALRKIVVYNFDPRNEVLTEHINWPVLTISASGRVEKVGPYVGMRMVHLSARRVVAK